MVTLVVFSDWKGIVHHEFVPCGQMLNKQLNQEILARLRDAVQWKRPKLWENQSWMLHHDNAPPHASFLIRSYLAKYQTSVVSHPPYFPDLTTVDNFFLYKHKTTLFPNHRGDSGKCDKRTACHHRNCIPGRIPTMKEMLGMVYHQ
jgi:hypothetical protein